ncbi:hypothetical protein [Glaciimonas soli]|uniref:Uncharacterized protein n=1 Tax=Glaciimonas soli TaxID=2590999 RepID=A0A843YYI8_9BURK|nr:hypothetical protein [Glaciimonas soli]MQR02321.1 hypothetical protein [Glaciimonas soli]
MPILAGDIQLIASKVMDDNEEGGGAPTAIAIHDGASNAIFPDISELDRAGGRVNLRKVFASVQTTDTDSYLGANVVVAVPPQDPLVSVTLFSTGQVFDTRSNARNRVESYLSSGSEWPAYLFENHIAGQRSIQLFQRSSETLPPVGQTLLLVQDEGQTTERAQYVRITKVSAIERAFTYDNDKDYKVLIVTCGLSDALRYDFSGSPAARTFIRGQNRTVVRDTVVADAATYCGVVPIVELVNIGDLKVKCKSIYTQLVPSAQTETPIIDANAAGEYDTLVDASNGMVTITTAQPFNAATNLYLGNPVVPNTLAINFTGGVLNDVGGMLTNGATTVGTINYANGLITFASTSPAYAGAKTITFKAAGAPLSLADSAGIAVTSINRAYNYVLTISPPPAPGSTRVAYRAQGKWVDLRDNGAGMLRGADAAFGSGTVSYSTGTIAVTLGALPDVGSTIIANWGSKANYLNRATAGVEPTSIMLACANRGVMPSSIVITWNNGKDKTALDNGNGGITGDATGTVNYVTGEIKLIPNQLPAGGQTYTVAYTYGEPDNEVFPAPIRNPDGTVSIALAKKNITPNTVSLTFNLLYENYDPVEYTIAKTDPYLTLKDNGSGSLSDSTGTAHGSINYTTGIVTFKPDTIVSLPKAQYGHFPVGIDKDGGSIMRYLFTGFIYVPVGAYMPMDESASVKVNYRAASSNTNAKEDITSSALTVDLTRQFSEVIVPGSIRFNFGGMDYFDRAGRLYTNLDVLTGSASIAGSIDYATGNTTITNWMPANANLISVKSLLTTIAGQPVDQAVFRAPVSPLRPGSLQIVATRLDGSQINVTANPDGTITGNKIIGHVDVDTGVINVRFGIWIIAAGNEGQPWYDASAVINGLLFRSYPVFASSIKFNAVAYSYLPLDANILGIDPVRLPQDGRVPIFRPGGYAVIGHTKISQPVTVSNKQTIDVARVRLSRVRVLDKNKQVINLGYSANLEAGTVTFTDVSTYAQPITIEDRIEDMAVVSDAQINGELSFTRQLSHHYPVGSYVSSALIAGDMKSRVATLFDQATWDGVSWRDAVVGNVATATYNDTLTPIQVSNIGTVTERWVFRFTNTNAFEVIGEHVGVIATGTTGNDCSPINPATHQPYFTIKASGWGSGWSVGNIVRMNTVGALFPVWVVRTIQQGSETVQDDAFTLLIRGDVDRP